MGGGLMQLVAYGAQDIYLTGNPQITFFKVVYRRHTNFAVESIEQTFNGSAQTGKKFSCTISRNGDLLSRIYLEIDLNDGTPSATPAVTDVAQMSGYDLIEYAEIEIGGQCIDKHYGEWMAIWDDLSHGVDKKNMLLRIMPDNTSEEVKNYIPLQFWFCRNPGLALPLIALQYHEVKLNVKFNPSNWNVTTAVPGKAEPIDKCCVFCDYIFLDTDERRRFAQVSHEYLIEQVQFSNDLMISTSGGQVELRFNHPVKALYWHDSDSVWNSTVNITSCLLQLNGHDRFRERSGTYFRNVQRYQHHSGRPILDLAGVHMYSFALKPEEHQPSGTCNFSRIDNAVLGVRSSTNNMENTLRVYAINYNVLRIMSGMGGLAYSN